MKKFIFGLSLFIILISSIACNVEDAKAKAEAENEMQRFFREKGFDKAEEITRDQFIDLIDFLLTKTLNQQESEKFGFKKYIPKHVAHVPEKFPRDNINKYVSQEVLGDIMIDFIDDRYPGETGEAMKKQLKEIQQRNQEKNKNDL